MKLLPSRPLLKWAGSKHRHVGTIMKLVPEAIKAKMGLTMLHDPFCGSASLILGAAKATGAEFLSLSDANKHLTDTLRQVQHAPRALLQAYDALRTQFAMMNDKERKQFYLGMRDLFNINPQPHMFMFLNRCGYGGLARYNNSGGYNVPYGPRKTVANAPVFEYSELLTDNVLIEHGDFTEALSLVGYGEFVVTDPPFMKEFSSYTPETFKDNMHLDMLQIISYLRNTKGVHAMICSSDNESTREMYGNADLRPIEYTTRQTIARDPKKRGAKKEILWVTF